MNFIDDVLSGRVALPMVPRVIERLLRVLRQNDASLSQIADELEQDPVLGSRVLRMANSSFFGGRRSMSSLTDAVSAIGFQSLETLLIASGAQAAFSDVPGVNLRQFWLTSVMTAACARQIAGVMKANGNTAYAAGLLQGVGHLILCKCHPDLAIEEFSSMTQLWGPALAERENAVFGVDHARVSAIWADKLGMPEEVVLAIDHSLDPPMSSSQALSGVLQLACAVAAAAAQGESLEEAMTQIDQTLLSNPALSAYTQSEDFATDFATLQTMPAPLN
ncbi:HDOD domain-containing protein [Roseateles sp. BYS180W]|uniref:HDOD domain-containing protein n=1 Tax=Roseateles rivi TaxID=3299028 RepID=A0ABW7FWR8_9BURK